MILISSINFAFPRLLILSNFTPRTAQLCSSPGPQPLQASIHSIWPHTNRPNDRQIPQIRIGNSSSDDPHIFSRRKASQIRGEEEEKKRGSGKVARICLFALETLNLSLFPIIRVPREDCFAWAARCCNNIVVL